MQRINKIFLALLATVVAMSILTLTPFTASAAVDNGESNCIVTCASDAATVDIKIPLIHLDPIPSLQVDQVEISFDMTQFS